MDCTNLKFVRKLNPPVVLHALMYPHLMMFADLIHIGRLDRPTCRLMPGIVGCCQIIVGGGHRINVSNDSMLVADCVCDGSVGDGSIGDGSIFVCNNSTRVSDNRESF